jgi:hypothetical protein
VNTRTKIILGSKRAFSTSIDNMLIERTIHATKPFMHDCELCDAGGEEFCDSCRKTNILVTRKESVI